jgi:hypothetical protein
MRARTETTLTGHISQERGYIFDRSLLMQNGAARRIEVIRFNYQWSRLTRSVVLPNSPRIARCLLLDYCNVDEVSGIGIMIAAGKA